MSNDRFLFASPQGFKRSQSAEGVSEEELLITINGNKAHYKHQGSEHTVTLPSNALDDDEAITHAVNTHIRSRLQAEPSRGWRGHGPVDAPSHDSHSETRTESHSETQSASWNDKKGDEVFDIERIRAFVIECCHDQCKRGVSQELAAVYGRLDRQREEIESLKECQVIQGRRIEQLVQSVNALNGILQGILGVRVNIAANGAIIPNGAAATM